MPYPTTRAQRPTDFFDAVTFLIDATLTDNNPAMSITISRRNGIIQLLAYDNYGNIIEGSAATLDDAIAAFTENALTVKKHYHA